MLKARTASSIFWFLLLWLVIFVFPAWTFAVLIIAGVGFGLYEFFNMVSNKGILVYKYFGIVTGCLIPLTMYLQLKPSEGVEFLLITTVCLCVFLLQFARRKTEQALIGIATTIFGIFYIAWFLSFMIKLRIAPPLGMDGRFLVLYLLIVTKIGDIGAYFVGSLFGKHYIIPHISPKKSFEGTISGIVISFAAAIVFRGFLPSVGFMHILIIGFILSFVGQIGDLSESLIKRDCGVKDSGSMFPGLGGVLDLIDSLIFTTPILYFYLKLIA